MRALPKRVHTSAVKHGATRGTQHSFGLHSTERPDISVSQESRKQHIQSCKKSAGHKDYTIKHDKMRKRKKEKKTRFSLGIKMQNNNNDNDNKPFHIFFPLHVVRSLHICLITAPTWLNKGECHQENDVWNSFGVSGLDTILTSPSEGWRQIFSTPMAEGTFSREKARGGEKMTAVSGTLRWKIGNWTSFSMSFSHYLQLGNQDLDGQQKPWGIRAAGSCKESLQNYWICYNWYTMFTCCKCWSWDMHEMSRSKQKILCIKLQKPNHSTKKNSSRIENLKMI